MTNTTPNQEHDTPTGSKLMTLAEFNRAKRGRPIQSDEAEEKLAEFNLKVVDRIRSGRHTTVLLDRTQAEAAITLIEAKRQRLSPPAWTPPVRMVTPDSLEADIREIKSMLRQLLERG